MPDTLKETRTGFRISVNQLREFKSRIAKDGKSLEGVLVQWIDEYLNGTRTLPGAPLPTKGICPLCESTLGVTADGLAMIKPGPIEPLAPGSVPDELVPLVMKFVESYLADPVFASTVNGIIAIHRQEKPRKHRDGK